MQLRTLLTSVTTASRTSPLKGLNTRQLYLTSNVARPEPSLRIRPCERATPCCAEIM